MSGSHKLGAMMSEVRRLVTKQLGGCSRTVHWRVKLFSCFRFYKEYDIMQVIGNLLGMRAPKIVRIEQGSMMQIS